MVTQIRPHKTEVLKALCTNSRTFSEIQDLTGFSKRVLNDILFELATSNLVTIDGDSYRIEDFDLFLEYCDQYEGKTRAISHKEQQVAIINEKKIDDGLQDSVIKRVIEWSKRNKLNYNESSEHFFVEGDLLNRLCKDVIDYSKTEVIVVNPNVYPCSLSDKLKETRGRSIKLITQSPSSEGKKASSRQKYHEVLLKNGVRILYNERIHAKMILLDSKIGIVSSLNFKSKSTSGRNHEAGMTTWQIDAIESIKKYIDNLLNDNETEEYSI